MAGTLILVPKQKREVPYQGTSLSRLDRTYAAFANPRSGLLVRW